MKGWGLLPFLFSVLLSSGLGDDTVAEDIGIHQLERLVELLSSTECEDLLLILSHPEEDIFQHLERLSPDNNQLDLKPRVRRDASSAADSEAQCRTALMDWLLRYGEHIYYDRLSRALQHVGRTDIAIEVGKNINQDKTLNLKRYVEDYHKYVSSLKFPSVQPDTENIHRGDQQILRRKARDLTCRDLDLIMERAPVPPYKMPDVVGPLLWGFLLGFGGTFLVGISIFLFILHLSRRDLSPVSSSLPL
ncbi:transmembrane and death domain protein 1 [Diretmus argenteus]